MRDIIKNAAIPFYDGRSPSAYQHGRSTAGFFLTHTAGSRHNRRRKREKNAVGKKARGNNEGEEARKKSEGVEERVKAIRDTGYSP